MNVKAGSFGGSKFTGLKGEERTKFVNTVLESTFYPERADGEVERLSTMMKSHVQEMMKSQKDPAHLERQALPPVPKKFDGPNIQHRVYNPRAP